MRRSQLFLLLFCLSLIPFAARLSSGNVSLSIDQETTKVSLRDGQSEVWLSVANPSARDFNAHVRCELVDPQDKVRASIERDEWLARGTAQLKLPLAPLFTGENAEELNRFLWYRLRYRITPTEGLAPIEGIISLSEITPSFFQLRVFAPTYTGSNTSYTARVLAVHPIFARPVAGVGVRARLKFDESEDGAVTATGTTGADGYAELTFSLPGKLKASRAELKINAVLDDFTQEAGDDIYFDRDASILISTDKPLYQPGQVLHLRALVFDAHRRAIPATPLSLRVLDPEGTVAFRGELTTSRFGAASQDWPIPASLRLGDYRLEVKIEDESYDPSTTMQTVKISRYDLPNFVVEAKPDKPYYLPGENAEVAVSSSYLFGQPVTRGHVRVVRETERNWNYLAQKWETTEEESFEGETDEAGKFTARINLEKEHSRLREGGRTYYDDISYAAYFTDPTTMRTEQRRFDLRVTKEAIHVYVVKDNLQQTKGFPTQFYLTTSYADGTPAPACEVFISDADAGVASVAQPSGNAFSLRLAHRTRTLPARVVTNRFGVARVSNLMLQGVNDDGRDVSLRLTARDKRGRSGRLTEEFSDRSSPVIRVLTDKALYRAGEPLKAVITASEPDLKVIVEVVRDWRVIRSELVRLVNGRALFNIPYDEHFKGRVSIVAYPDDEDASLDLSDLGTRTVLYPNNEEELKLDVRTERTSYRPGEEASASVQVTTVDGRPVESALGVVVFDRAVEERSRTDSEFGGNGSYGFYMGGAGGGVAGLRLADFMHADPSRPLPAGLDLVAEILLAHAHQYNPAVFTSDGYNPTRQGVMYEPWFARQFGPLNMALAARYVQKSEYPLSEEALLRYLSEAGINFRELRDPWGTPYRTSFGWNGEDDVTEIDSAGADKRFETSDDFATLKINRPYFRPFGEKIDRVLSSYQQRTGQLIHDAATLKRELKEQEGLDFDSLRDHRGEPYQLDFDGEGQTLLLSVQSRNKSFGYDPRGVYQRAEFTVWRRSLDYFTELRTRANSALLASMQTMGRAPRDEKEIRDTLLQASLKPEDLLDPWGQPYYFGIRSWATTVDRYSSVRRARYGQPLVTQLERRPVSQQFYFITMRSAGKDARANTRDDFTVGVFYHTTGELDYLKKNPLRQQMESVFGPLTGTVAGVQSMQGLVLDSTGARVVGANVTLSNATTGIVRTTTTDEEGFYRFVGLQAGYLYTVEVAAQGFARSIIEQMPINAGILNSLDITLEAGDVNASVMIEASESPMINSTQSQLSQTYTPSQLTQLPLGGSIDNLALLTPGIVSPGDANFRNGVGISATVGRGTSTNFQLDGQDNNDGSTGGVRAGQISTPRVREYFPETLLWQPALETGADGRAQFSFKLADNITTWKLSVIGSTVDGRIGVAGSELRAFQPFFVEHDPPRVLTEGDRIELPVVLRNYLEQPQEVEVELKPESWFTLLGDARQRATVKASDATRAVFSLRAAASITDGKQRVTATGTEASDAIEKPVTVHPDGEEMSVTKSLLMTDAATMELNFPADAIAGSTKAELKIYPGMMSHVIESIEGIMQRPYGCGEQTISSTYPSLLALRADKRSGLSSPVRATAERYLRLGYERLLGYRAPGGGFTYWGRGDADFALSAYALRFLSDAREFLPVDEKVLEETRSWLLRQQRADGSWHDSHYSSGAAGEAARDAKLTAYVTRLLLLSRRDKDESEAAQTAALARALDYLRQRAPEMNEPYFAASYALAAIEAGEPARATEAVGKLRALSHDEGHGSSWSSQTATPFYGWGQAERIETTALVVQALKRFDRAEDQDLAWRGLLYLLGNKDRYGVWYSTQATVNVLDTLITGMMKEGASGATDGTDEAEIFVNGQRATSVRLPPEGQPSAPLYVDLSQYLAAGNNSIEIRRAGATRPAAVQAVQTYYVPWTSPSASVRNASASSRALHLAVSYDRTEVAVGDSVTCRVQAGRTSGAGYYGMMLAEIGLPPGADVDRASLEKAMSESGWSLSRYDVLPDRLVVYLWPRTGGATGFEFKFRTRFGLSAQTAPSVVYDYYNPEARTVLAPTRFTVNPLN